MRFSTYISAVVIAVLPTAAAAQPRAAISAVDCPYGEPDSVQISWTSPCNVGTWLLDTETGCRMWDWHPDPKDKAVWSGACPQGQKQGYGVLQWSEHGLPIDRFQGTYVDDRRQGFGRYDWNATDHYEGLYANDVPQGYGKASIAGEVFTGIWHRGCFRKADRVVAINVPRRSCGAGISASLDRSGPAAF